MSFTPDYPRKYIKDKRLPVSKSTSIDEVMKQTKESECTGNSVWGLVTGDMLNTGMIGGVDLDISTPF